MRSSDEKARHFTSRMRKIYLERPAAGTANQHNVLSTAVGPVRINPLRYRKSKQRSQSRSMKGGLIMATTRIMPLHIGKGRTESQAISDIIDYAANPQKTDNGRLITGFGCDSRIADAEFLLAKRQYISATGRVRGSVQILLLITGFCSSLLYASFFIFL